MALEISVESGGCSCWIWFCFWKSFVSSNDHKKKAFYRNQAPKSKAKIQIPSDSKIKNTSTYMNYESSMSYSIRRPEGLHLFKTPGSTPATWFHLWRHLPLLGSTPQSWSSSPSLGTKTPGNVGETTPLDQQSCLERDQQTPEIRKISFPKMSQMPHWEMEWHEARLVLQRRHEAWIFDISWNVYSQSKQTSVVFGKSLEESTQHLQSEMVPFCTSLGDSPNQHFLKNNNPNETVDEHQFRKGSLHTCRSTRCGHPPWWELHCTADIAGVESASHTVHPARWKKTDVRDTNEKRV